MKKGCSRWAGLSVASLLLLGLAECGGTNDSRSTESPASAGTAAAGGSAGATLASGGSEIAGSTAKACVTPSAAGYEPNWTPPSSPVAGACTEQQTADEWALCEPSSGTFDQKECRAFDTDPTNAACLGCMFGALGQANAGALLVLPGGQWIANRAGCIALIDGDVSETGCGAHMQAADVCVYTACLAACTEPVSEADFAACQKAAGNAACSAYANKAACGQLPRYASCQYSTFSEYYNAMTDLFCVSGGPGGAPQGGAAGAAP